MTEGILFQINGVDFSYDKVPVLKNIDLTVKCGKFYGIMGPNGCGKTTLLDLLIGSKTPARGVISYKGKEIRHYRRRALARELSLVPQEFDTGFGFTVEEIVMMGRHPYIERFGSPSKRDYHCVEKALELINICELRNRYISSLSGGQKQRAIVARALAQQTPVLLFDEATSSLDIKFSLHIFNIGQQLVKDEGKTIIAVIHDLNLAAAYCDDMIFMKNGTIRRVGPTKEVFNPETISDIFNIKTNVAQNPFNDKLQVSFQYTMEKQSTS